MDSRIVTCIVTAEYNLRKGRLLESRIEISWLTAGRRNVMLTATRGNTRLMPPYRLGGSRERSVVIEMVERTGVPFDSAAFDVDRIKEKLGALRPTGGQASRGRRARSDENKA
jgi:hypothetical protein